MKIIGKLCYKTFITEDNKVIKLTNDYNVQLGQMISNKFISYYEIFQKNNGNMDLRRRDNLIIQEEINNAMSNS